MDLSIVLSILASIIIQCHQFNCLTIQLSYTTKEHDPIGQIIGNIKQNPKLISQYGQKQYELRMPKSNQYIKLLASNSDLIVRKIIDREKICSRLVGSSGKCLIELLIIVKQRSQASMDYLEVKFEIIDINDNAPSWYKKEIIISIPEHTKIGTKYRLPIATDSDMYPNNTVKQYRLQQDYTDLFGLLYNVGVKSNNLQKRRGQQKQRQQMQFEQLWLKVIADLDREQMDNIVKEEYRLTLIAEDGGHPMKWGSIVLVVRVTDINDHTPQFDLNMPTIVKLSENNEVNQLIYKVAATDQDKVSNQSLQYSFGYSIGSIENSHFSIDAQSGAIKVTKVMDYEDNYVSIYYLPIQVTDGQFISEKSLAVQIIDVNDNAPEISIFSHVTNENDVLLIKENIRNSSITMVTLTTTDRDNRSANIVCQCLDIRVRLEKVKTNNGELIKYTMILVQSLDRENSPLVRIIVNCVDDGYPSLTGQKIVEIKVIDENDCVPHFSHSKYQVSVEEGQSTGSLITQLNTTDCDEADNAKIIYSLLSNLEQSSSTTFPFMIDQDTGQVRVTGQIDREVKHEYTLTIAARDSPSDQKKQLSSTTILTISIIDINDCIPIFRKSHYHYEVPESSPARSFVGNVIADDCDINPEFRKISYSIQHTSKDIRNKYLNLQMKMIDNADYLYVTKDGNIYTTGRTIDREHLTSISIQVSANDGQHQARVPALVTVQIVDINDNRPQWDLPTSSGLPLLINITYSIGLQSASQLVTTLRATDRDIGVNSALTYSIIQGNEHGKFRLDSISGLLYYSSNDRKSIATTTTTKLIVRVTDAGHPPLDNTTVIIVTVYSTKVSSLSFSSSSSAASDDYSQRSSTISIEKDLVIMICMITVTMVVSSILVVAIVMLKCRQCRCGGSTSSSHNNNNSIERNLKHQQKSILSCANNKYDLSKTSPRHGNPDGRSSPTASDTNNSIQKSPSDVELISNNFPAYHHHQHHLQHHLQQQQQLYQQQQQQSRSLFYEPIMPATSINTRAASIDPTHPFYYYTLQHKLSSHSDIITSPTSTPQHHHEYKEYNNSRLLPLATTPLLTPHSISQSPPHSIQLPTATHDIQHIYPVTLKWPPLQSHINSHSQEPHILSNSNLADSYAINDDDDHMLMTTSQWPFTVPIITDPATCQSVSSLSPPPPPTSTSVSSCCYTSPSTINSHPSNIDNSSTNNRMMTMMMISKDQMTSFV